MSEEVSFGDFLYQIAAIDRSSYEKIILGKGSVDELVESGALDKSLVDDYKSVWHDTQQTTLSTIDSNLFTILPENKSRTYKAVIFGEDDDCYHIATTNPLNDEMITYFDAKLDKPLELYVAKESVIDSVINRLYRKTKEIIKLGKEAESFYGDNGSAKEFRDEAHSAAVVDMVNLILIDAIRYGATDIHIEKNDRAFYYFYRVGHETSREVNLPASISMMLKQRILILSGGSITETQKPQDLHYKFHPEGDLLGIDVRISILYTAGGFSMVLRLLKSQQELIPFETIFSSKDSYEVAERFIQMKSGLCLVTGPTSSGKTTLLYSMMSEMAGKAKKIITVEDPVEVKYDYLNQIQVEPERGLSFADVLRSSLRQNPDVLMIGEIRDSETAVMATRASLTGTLTFSTLHTENINKTVARLLDLEVDQFLLSTSIKLIMCVRLLRKNCTHCIAPYKLSTEQRNEVMHHFPEFNEEKYNVKQSTGCVICEESGKYGQVLISEYALFTSDIRTLIQEGDLAALNEVIDKKASGRRLLDNAFTLFTNGVIPYSEFCGEAVNI